MRDVTTNPHPAPAHETDGTPSGSPPGRINSTLCEHCRWIGGQHDRGCRAAASITGIDADRDQLVYRRPAWMAHATWGRLVVQLSAEWDRLVEEYVR